MYSHSLPLGGTIDELTAVIDDGGSLSRRHSVILASQFPRQDAEISLSAAGDQPLAQLPDVLDLRDVADLLRVHQKTVRLMALKGAIPGFRAGRLWRFKKTKIEQWLNDAADV